MTSSRRQIRYGLKLKFILPLTVTVTVIMAAAGFYFIERQAESFKRELEVSGDTMIRMLATNAESGVLFGSTLELDQQLKVLSKFESVGYALIIDAEGTILAQAGEVPPFDRSIDSTDLSIDSVTIERQTMVHENGKTELVLKIPIVTFKSVINREQLGMNPAAARGSSLDESREVIGFVELGLSTEKVEHLIGESTLAIAGLTLILILVTLGLVVLIVNVFTKPINRLLYASEQIAAGNLSIRSEVNQEDEIGQLAEAFDHMADSMQKSRSDIEEYNKTLEEKIIERTKQLEDAQAQLIQTEKMGAIGQLAAGVAHELNNPLGGILGYAQFTLEKLGKLNPEKTSAKDIESFARYVSDIEIQARRCKAIVQNLLRFSRSSRTVDFGELDLNKVVLETISFVEHQAHINRIRIDSVFASQLPPIHGNSGQLQQVLTNLLINAMHASQPGTAITVRTRFSPAVGEFGGTVELTVTDQGSGIPKENLKKIFEPFFTTKEIGKGTGLGLSVSFGIINDHGGEISVQSTVGVGTTFTIILPIQKIHPVADTVR